MKRLAGIGSPVVWFLDISGKLVLHVLGQGGEAEETVTEEEVRTIIAEATSAGVTESDEHSMIVGVMRLADRSVRGLVTPRLDVEVVNLADGLDEIHRTILSAHRSRLLVQDGDADAIIGVVALKDILPVYAGGQLPDLRRHVQSVPVVMAHTDALTVSTRCSLVAIDEWPGDWRCYEIRYLRIFRSRY